MARPTYLTDQTHTDVATQLIGRLWAEDFPAPSTLVVPASWRGSEIAPN